MDSAVRGLQSAGPTIGTLLRKQTVASLHDVMAALGPRRRQAHRVPQAQGPRRSTSYSHRGAYYTLADLDERGLWAFVGVHFSRVGTLVATAEAFVNHADSGHFVDELDNLLGVSTRTRCASSSATDA